MSRPQKTNRTPQHSCLRRAARHTTGGRDRGGQEGGEGGVLYDLLCFPHTCCAVTQEPALPPPPPLLTLSSKSTMSAGAMPSCSATISSSMLWCLTVAPAARTAVAAAAAVAASAMTDAGLSPSPPAASVGLVDEEEGGSLLSPCWAWAAVAWLGAMLDWGGGRGRGRGRVLKAQGQGWTEEVTDGIPDDGARFPLMSAGGQHGEHFMLRSSECLPAGLA